jgi:hypothetical protein
MKFENVRNPLKHVYRFPNVLVHVAGFGREDFGVLWFDVMVAA